ncbi:MAG: hypothetical protein P8J26_00740, partial [Pseudomonadales bacterium]|nr:hypothetical protein [Pseudomonadales bacterium]
AILGKLPTRAEYMEFAEKIDAMSGDIFRYMNFNEMDSYVNAAEEGSRIAAVEVREVGAL